MSNVTNISDYRPHKSGLAICLHCSHEWAAVSQINVHNLECPECGLEKGVYQGLASPPEGSLVYECECGCQRFEILISGAFCINCGQTHTFEAVIDG